MTNSSDLKRLHALCPLNWTSTESRTKNTSFNLSATDDFRSFQNRIILQYHIYVIYPETNSTAEPEYQLMINGTNTHLVQPCTSVDACKALCETWRAKFWNDLLNNILSNMFAD